MKKRLFITAAVCAAALAMTACGAGSNNETTAQETAEAVTEAASSESKVEILETETDAEQEDITANYFTDKPVKGFGTVVEVNEERGDIMMFVPFDEAISGENRGEQGPIESGKQETADGQDIIFHTIDGVPFVDAETGLPLGIGDIEVGSKAYVWSNGIMTMSLPGQTSMQAMVVGTEDALKDVEYVVAAEVKYNQADNICEITDQNGGKWAASATTEIVPFKTRQIVTLDDIQKGSRMMIWDNGSRIVLFN
ncbi:MAG: hypothetical protein PUC98_08990 [Clostridiales bacterium]|nr:hypothetical protein [Clostridiales bacterium]